MNLQDAIAQDLPLLVKTPQGGERAAGYVFLFSGGVIYVDTGFGLVLGQHFHAVQGEVTGDGPWKVGDAEVSILVEADPLHAAWKQYRDTARRSRWVNRAAALRTLQSEMPQTFAQMGKLLSDPGGVQ